MRGHLLAASLFLLWLGTTHCQAAENAAKPFSSSTVCKDDSGCENFGKCKRGSCECPEGTEGDRCEKVPGCDALEATCKKHDGFCYYLAEAENHATCSCPDSSQDFDPVKKICRIICKHDYTCEHLGKCKSGSCECPEGTEGDVCEKIPGCGALEDTCKKGNGYCDYDENTENHATCRCHGGIKKFDPVKKICMSCIDDKNCQNSGKCKGGSCECPEGTEGEICEEVPGCVAFEKICKNANGWCEYDANTENHTTCLCSDVTQEFDPAEKICKKRNTGSKMYIIIPVVIIIIAFIVISIGIFVYRSRK